MAKYQKKNLSWPEETEDSIDSVVKSVADDVEFIIDSFMPDGRRFREQAMSEEEQLKKYVEEGLHDNPAAAANWIRTRVVQLTQELQKYGVPPEMVAQVHPYDIFPHSGLDSAGHQDGVAHAMKNLFISRTNRRKHSTETH